MRCCAGARSGRGIDSRAAVEAAAAATRGAWRCCCACRGCWRAREGVGWLGIGFRRGDLKRMRNRRRPAAEAGGAASVVSDVSVISVRGGRAEAICGRGGVWGSEEGVAAAVHAVVGGVDRVGRRFSSGAARKASAPRRRRPLPPSPAPGARGLDARQG
eukprot:364753-Chlamydomonas_euryale.AAC.5